ncbi:MAG: arginase family protein [Thermoleophilia bacterium]|nr:arginase family protein [Thermoleophilia bacterium]
MSRLRARCPDCRTLTAVAIGPEYQCHTCGREFAAGLVRVPRAWGDGGETMAAAAHLELPYPEAGVIEGDTLAEQNLLLASELPARPLVLGGCCCSHVGAIEALSAGEECLAVVWIDAHGDLNTPQTSPSGNAWGMPLRMVIDDGAVLPRNVALVGARSLDPPEVDFIVSAGVQTGDGAVDRALDGADAVYVALDCDGFDPGELAVFMPEPDGLRLEEVEALLADLAARTRLAGLGFTGLVRDPANEPKLARLAAAAGL